MTDTDLIAETRKNIIEARDHVEHFAITGGDGVRVTRLADNLEALLAEVSALREVIEKAKADAWDEGRAGAIADHRPPLSGFDNRPNPYRPVVASPETKES